MEFLVVVDLNIESEEKIIITAICEGDCPPKIGDIVEIRSTDGSEMPGTPEGIVLKLLE